MMKSCLVCGKNIPQYDFCMKHIPKYGEEFFVNDWYTVVFCGSVPVWKLLFYKAFDTKVIRWWWGTDALTLHAFPPGLSRLRIRLHRLKARMIEPFISEHWVFSNGLGAEIRPFVGGKEIRTVIPPPDHAGIKRRPSRGALVVGFYYPKTARSKFNRWKYGLDLIQAAANELAYENIRFLAFTGNETENALKRMDCYIRPSRHDGTPRLVLACQELGIPYYYREDFKPDVVDLIEFIQEQRIKKEDAKK